jgi:hypothetical protein
VARTTARGWWSSCWRAATLPRSSRRLGGPSAPGTWLRAARWRRRPGTRPAWCGRRRGAGEAGPCVAARVVRAGRTGRSKSLRLLKSHVTGVACLATAPGPIRVDWCGKEALRVDPSRSILPQELFRAAPCRIPVTDSEQPDGPDAGDAAAPLPSQAARTCAMWPQPRLSRAAVPQSKRRETTAYSTPSKESPHLTPGQRTAHLATNTPAGDLKLQDSAIHRWSKEHTFDLIGSLAGSLGPAGQRWYGRSRRAQAGQRG